MDLDILGEVLSYLKPVDIYKLSLTSKYYHRNINVENYIVKEINRRLYDIFNDKLDQFIILLKQLKAVISGSFIIQCILGEYYNGSDIDVFIPHNYDQDHLISFMKENGECFISEEGAEYEYMCINNVIDFKFLTNQRIQFIILDKKETINSYIDEYFDFEICKNSWDCNNIKIKNISNLSNKVIDLKNIKYTDNLRDRYQKYKDREFTFINEKFMNLENINIYRNPDCNHSSNLVPDDIICHYSYLYIYNDKEHCIFDIIFNEYIHQHVLCQPIDSGAHCGGHPDLFNYILLSNK